MIELLGLGQYSATALGFLVFTAFIAGLARGFSGFGSAMIFMPLASMVAGAQVASPLLLLIDFTSSLALIPGAWRRADRRDVGIMSIGALIGVPLGTLTLAYADPLAIRWGLVVIILVLLALMMSGWRYAGKPTIPTTIGVGSIAGFFGSVAQVGGPPIVLYWLRETAAVTRANIILYFAISDVLIVASYFIGHLWTATIVGLGVITGPVFAIGLWFGSKLFGKASDDAFRRICYALIAVSALISLPLFDGVFH
jgi:uncharacterized protein